MIIIKLIGGLGNQMFQYAGGLSLSKALNTELKIDNLYFNDHSKRLHRFEYRPYALDLFNISSKIATPKEIRQFTVPRIYNKYIYHLLLKIKKSKNILNESDFTNSSELYSLVGKDINVYLTGYYQDYKRFKDYLDVLKKEFVFKELLPESHHQIRSLIESSENSIAVTFRRGDYVNHPSLGIINLEYYEKALDVFKNKKISGPIFVFSDDINWCRKNFKPKSFETIFVDQGFTGPKGGYYLQLMMLNDHFIIPNSTYPYWGALLSETNDKKIVIAPKIWYKGQNPLVRNSILPPEWLVI